MSEQKKKLKKKQKKKLRQIFLRTVVVTLIILSVIIGAFVFVYNKFLYNGDGGLISLEKEPDPINKTLAVFGVDEDGYRTDVIFVVNYNSETGKSRVISIPRDTKVDWSEEQQAKMEEIKGYSVSVSKINEMTSYVGMEHINEFTIPEIEELLDIQIDNYVIITIDAFKQIVDAIGGVEVDVPVLDGNGLHYDDNSQDLHIHLDPGLQLLDGEAAEGLVRFRKGYAEGDVGRIKTQQLFLEAFAKKITSPQIITKIPNIIKTVFDTVSTDIKLSEISGYLPYLKSLSTDKLTFNIIPGEGQYIGSKSYFIVDEAAMPAFLEEVFNDNTEASEEVVIDKSVSIEVLNSTTVGGAASRARDALEAEGYSVGEIGNYGNAVLDTTMIYTKDESLARQFLSYYPNATIEVEPTLQYDIRIILGNKDVTQ
ncbi:MAG: LCP family protein [Candidatus Cellulosilyticum pullistercoris]|uniref:LCP family protein n=1 Tax=Candidatus Cellulosilyticum pullistercoris TaxID=2838521 RepID=A0A9E2KC96_9FIRM|nr:LCP family protein [Candidatus Cellulosilyticum pullistercoris]